MRISLLPAVVVLASSIATLAADPAPVRPVPPPGVEIPAADRAELEKGVAALAKEIDALRSELKSKPDLLALLPDVMIFHKAVDWALRYNEIFDVKQVASAKRQLELGMQRAKELRDGKPSWLTATGLVPRGYLSAIDGSVQPYGMIVPDDWKPGDKPRRLDFWCHGRGEKLSELDFINQRLTSKGEFTPEGAFVLHLYGRYCCANKFAGEVDLFEALADAKKHYAIDDSRLVVRGFSMGGASTWQFGFHFPGMWAAVMPGAGFAETEEFFGRGLYAEGATPPPWFERTLWRWYDATICARNVAGLSLAAYSGEIDGQKQAADIMLRFALQEGHSFTHIIGPNVPHKYHPDSKPVLDKFAEVATTKGLEAVPKSVTYTTYSLLYPRRAWVELLGLEKSWERADLDATIDKETLTVKTKNISTVRLSPGLAGFPPKSTPKLVIDGTALPFEGGTAVLQKVGGKWQPGNAPTEGKRPGLCGPVDHALMSKFIFVRPTGKPLNDSVGKWAASELTHAVDFWRKVYRGDAPVKDDSAISDDDIASSNLILWGDPSSNKVMAKLIAKLPLKWDGKSIEFGGKTYDAANHAPILIFPNPLNPQKYVVLNSGVTFREFALLNNSDQTPKLPDWAIIDLRTAPDAKWPGLVENAGFFDEKWQYTDKQPR